MKNETKAYKTLRKNILNVKEGDRIDRVENVVGEGMPDVNYCFDGVEGWIEMKVPTEPKRKSTPLFGSNHPLLQSQKNWFKRQYNAIGKGYILIATNKRWMLISLVFADHINEMTVDDLIRISSWTATKPIKEEKWQLLRYRLMIK